MMVRQSAAKATLSDVQPPESIRMRLGAANVLRLPPDLSLEFAKGLLVFLNARGDRQVFRLVLDEDGVLLERALAGR